MSTGRVVFEDDASILVVVVALSADLPVSVSSEALDPAILVPLLELAVPLAIKKEHVREHLSASIPRLRFAAALNTDLGLGAVEPAVVEEQASLSIWSLIGSVSSLESGRFFNFLCFLTDRIIWLLVAIRRSARVCNASAASLIASACVRHASATSWHFPLVSWFRSCVVPPLVVA